MKLPPQEHLDDVNAVVQNSTAMGAYYIGLVSVIVSERTGAFPTRAELQGAAMCTSAPGAVELANLLVSEIQRKRKRRAARKSSAKLQ
jgi:hypothetical protein